MRKLIGRIRLEMECFRYRLGWRLVQNLAQRTSRASFHKIGKQLANACGTAGFMLLVVGSCTLAGAASPMDEAAKIPATATPEDGYVLLTFFLGGLAMVLLGAWLFSAEGDIQNLFEAIERNQYG